MNINHLPGPKDEGVCCNCGAGLGLHQFETYQCPKYGVEETREGYKQVWADTVYINADYKRLQEAAPYLLKACVKFVESFKSLQREKCDVACDMAKEAIAMVFKDK